MKLNKIGAKHGVGIITHIKDRVEAPAAQIIINAHWNLEKYVCTRVENEFKAIVDQKFAYLCYDGLWYDSLMTDLNAFIDKVNEKVTGKVTVKLHKGKAETVALETAKKVEKNVLLSIGKVSNKRKLLPKIKELSQVKGFKFYATGKTCQLLKDNQIAAIRVYKISQPRKKPNIKNLLKQNRFDLIINIPTKRGKKTEVTDGKIIRQSAIEHNISLITDVSVVEDFIEKLIGER